jgi:hypothetical protein
MAETKPVVQANGIPRSRSRSTVSSTPGINSQWSSVAGLQGQELFVEHRLTLETRRSE